MTWTKEDTKHLQFCGQEDAEEWGHIQAAAAHITAQATVIELLTQSVNQSYRDGYKTGKEHGGNAATLEMTAQFETFRDHVAENLDDLARGIARGEFICLHTEEALSDTGYDVRQVCAGLIRTTIQELCIPPKGGKVAKP